LQKRVEMRIAGSRAGARPYRATRAETR